MKRLGLMFMGLFVCFCFYFVVTDVITFGDDCPEVVDQQQLLDGTLAGFGEYNFDNGKGAVRYRGQTFTPGKKFFTKLKFNIDDIGFTDLRVFVDTVKEDGFTPEHNLDGAIYSWTIPNSEIKRGLTEYRLPQELELTVGKKYIFYFAPYKNGEYCDDYRNMWWSSGNPYDGGKGIVNINGEWMASDWGNIDAQFETDGRECSIPPPPPPTPEPQPTPVVEKLKVDYTIPFDDQINVDPNTLVRIEVVFSLPMDGGGFINTSAISLSNSRTRETVPIHKVEVDGKKVFFYPVPATIQYKEGYEATIFKDRVRADDNAGTTLDKDHTWTFGTRENPNPPPTPMPTPTPVIGKLKVEKTIPKNGETGVSVDLDKLDAFFNLPVDESGFVNQFSAELREEVDEGKVGVKITINYIGIDGGKVEFFITSGSLMPDKTYRMTLFKDRIRGKNGEMMDKDFSWIFSTGTKPLPTPSPTPPKPTPTPPKPTPTPPEPTPTPAATPTPSKKCVDVEIFNLSTRDMEIYVGDETEIVVTVECEEGFSLQGIPIHAKMVRWDDKRKVGKISLNGLTKKYERQTVLTDDEGKARFAVEGLRDGWLKVKIKVKNSFGFFRDVVKVRVRK